jgi:hypothetical protein
MIMGRKLTSREFRKIEAGALLTLPCKVVLESHFSENFETIYVVFT